jgi:competence protein ComGC
LNKSRPAFTIIEILISVIIISFSIVYVLKVHSQNHAQIVYITERNKLSLQDSLFLSEDVTSYHKDKKNAYELLRAYFKIDDFKVREILKKSHREFFIPEPVTLSIEEDSGPAATIEEIKLKGEYSSSYFRFNISGL